NESRWALIRSNKQIDNIIKIVEEKPGMILYTMINKQLEKYLQKKCMEININAHPILDSTIIALKEGFELKTKNEQIPGKQHSLSDDYFKRIEALQYAIANDDGQAMEQKKADIILFGVSRTSKTPTAIYLANKGIKVANIPFVLNQDPNLSNISESSLVVGLFASPERLQQIRISRLKSLKERSKTEYINIELLEKEVIEAKKICLNNKWVTIDVNKKSIEEIAATVLEYYKIFKRRSNDK
ncbi:MAG: pyruvate, phosphate dikinase/phosphoenolpyruvate synthase regulator, partial [Pseudomonadota bacterium]|nr:pyruvate, phosphate dikinase/phosphoenolpyruvate synthase regulator [Pseudomonadota bacterium]